MVEPVSEFAFKYNGKLVDLVMMKYEARNCGGRKIHEKGQALCTLACIVADINEGFEVDENRIDWALAKYANA